MRITRGVQRVMKGSCEDAKKEEGRGRGSVAIANTNTHLAKNIKSQRGEKNCDAW